MAGGDDLEKRAIEELLRETDRARVRAETMGPAGWLKCPLRTTNKRFLLNTLRSTGLRRRSEEPRRGHSTTRGRLRSESPHRSRDRSRTPHRDHSPRDKLDHKHQPRDRHKTKDQKRDKERESNRHQDVRHRRRREDGHADTKPDTD
ncbi:protein POLR1D-like [Betta splendens]|uniref:Protein POLR1D-like n=1 Tax=Betta splendens TaxID=158456 RepID=A0A6P7MF23_BETSP|nr:protein POLR1D-like [Betta splendens]